MRFWLDDVGPRADHAGCTRLISACLLGDSGAELVGTTPKNAIESVRYDMPNPDMEAKTAQK